VIPYDWKCLDGDEPSIVAGCEYEDAWQADHPDEFAAAERIGRHKRYSISRVASSHDRWRIIGAGVDLTVPGADLPRLADELEPQPPDAPEPIVRICGHTDGEGYLSVPGSPSVVAAIEARAAASKAAA
jgi:hypothetical protein